MWDEAKEKYGGWTGHKAVKVWAEEFKRQALATLVSRLTKRKRKEVLQRSTHYHKLTGLHGKGSRFLVFFDPGAPLPGGISTLSLHVFFIIALIIS